MISRQPTGLQCGRMPHAVHSPRRVTVGLLWFAKREPLHLNPASALERGYAVIVAAMVGQLLSFPIHGGVLIHPAIVHSAPAGSVGPSETLSRSR